MIYESQIKEKLSELLNEEISLENFEDWLAPASRSMFRSSPSSAINLVSSIHLLLDEYDDHMFDEPALRDSLRALINNTVHMSVWIDAPKTSAVQMKPSWSFTAGPAVLARVPVRL